MNEECEKCECDHCAQDFCEAELCEICMELCEATATIGCSVYIDSRKE